MPEETSHEIDPNKTVTGGQDVYASAPHPFARLASPLAARARQRRHERFFALTGLAPDARILDVGCGRLGLRALEPTLNITGVDIAEQSGYPGPFVCADVTAGLPFADGEFDLVYCSSVIEHVEPADRAAFAAELRRVGRGWFVQTPARSFPIEPHALLPFVHWLPRPLRRRYWRLGAADAAEEISLLSRRELEALFGPALPERLGPLVKSWVCVRPSVRGDGWAINQFPNRSRLE
jgi:SAM-dependent methyltransferase